MFHAFTRKASLESCYQPTNYNKLVSNYNNVTPERHSDLRQTYRLEPSCTNRNVIDKGGATVILDVEDYIKKQIKS